MLNIRMIWVYIKDRKFEGILEDIDSICFVRFLATLSSNYEIKRKKSRFENSDFMWWMGKFR